MKKVIILFALLGGMLTQAQTEKYFQTVDDLAYKSNRATAIMLFAEKFPDVKLVTSAPQVLDSIFIIKDEKRTAVAFELLQIIDPANNALIQFAYLNDQLYGKNISILYQADQMELANNKFDSVNIRLAESNRMKYFRNGGDVATIDKNIGAGKTRVYPIKRVEPDILEITTGVVLNIEDQEQLSGMGANKGIWVFLTIYNTFDQPVNLRFNFPKLVTPYKTIDELLAKQAKMPETYSIDKVKKEEAERKAKMEADKKAKEEAAAKAAEENNKGKKKKKNKKDK